MLSKCRVCQAVAVCVLFLSLDAVAQPTPKFEFKKDEAKEVLEAKEDLVEWKAAAQGGLIITTGNSEVTTLSGGFNASRKSHGNKLALEAGAAYARSSIFLAVDGNGNGAIEPEEVSRPEQTTTRAWHSKARYDRFLTERNSLYAAAGAAGDRPAGKDLVGNGQLGYSRAILSEGDHVVLGEAGYDFTYENRVTGDALSIHSLRLFSSYTGKVGDDTSLDTSLEYLANVNELGDPPAEVGAFQDIRVTYKISLTTNLFGDLSFRFGFEARYDTAPAPRPPFALPYADGFVPLADVRDTKTEATLIYNFL